MEGFCLAVTQNWPSCLGSFSFFELSFLSSYFPLYFAAHCFCFPLSLTITLASGSPLAEAGIDRTKYMVWTYMARTDVMVYFDVCQILMMPYRADLHIVYDSQADENRVTGAGARVRRWQHWGWKRETIFLLSGHLQTLRQTVASRAATR